MPHTDTQRQIFGAVLVSLGAATALQTETMGFELDMLHVAICFAGAGLFVFDAPQRITMSQRADNR